MLKRLVNECRIMLRIEPTGPILIKAGAQTLAGPDMAFVRVWRNGAQQVYLPGSSLKGVLRSHAERIARAVSDRGQVLACDPFAKKGSDRFCGECFEERRRDGIPERFRLLDAAREPDIVNQTVYADSCVICRLFGSTWFAGRLAIGDAYAIGNPPGTQTRDSVGIDRFTGGAASGAKFDLEVVASGAFETRIHIRNFELWQLGLLAFVLEDLKDGLIRIGAGKSRGMGEVIGTVTDVEVGYFEGPRTSPPAGGFTIRGMDSFVTEQLATGYNVARHAPVPVEAALMPRAGLRPKWTVSGQAFPWGVLAQVWTEFAASYENREAMAYVRENPGGRV